MTARLAIFCGSCQIRDSYVLSFVYLLFTELSVIT